MDNLSTFPVTQVLSKAGLSAGTTTTYSTSATVVYAIRSKLYSKGAVTNGATPTTDATTGAAFVPVPVNGASVFVFGFDASGNIKVSQGQVQSLDASGAIVVTPQMPVVPDTVAPFAYLVVKVGSTGSAWTFGSSNLSGATGVTYAFQDITALPDRPQIA